MSFWHRLRYYVAGLILGSLIVYALLIRNRDGLPAWTPNDRVIQELCLSDIEIPGDINLPFPDSLLKGRIKQSAVRFSESDVHSADGCRTYQLRSDVEEMRLRICPGRVSLVSYTAPL